MPNLGVCVCVCLSVCVGEVVASNVAPDAKAVSEFAYLGDVPCPVEDDEGVSKVDVGAVCPVSFFQSDQGRVCAQGGASLFQPKFLPKSPTPQGARSSKWCPLYETSCHGREA